MTAHSSGSGSSWNETLDVDQPHGLDYQEWNDIRIGVRKRIAQEHASFADSTVGGIHKPGRSAILEIGDATPPATRDGSYGGHSLLWDNSSILWCWTAVAGATAAPGVAGTADWTILKMHPDLQWAGGDITWTGAHEFDASVDITGPLHVDGSSDFSDVFIEGDLTVAGKFVIDGSSDFSDAYIEGDLSIDGDLVVDGTAVFTSEVDVSGNLDVTGTLGLFQFTADVSGYTYLPNDIIMQWGQKTLADNNATDITYTIAFPNAAWQVTISSGSGAAPANESPAAYDIDLDHFSAKRGHANNSPVRWIAIGN